MAIRIQKQYNILRKTTSTFEIVTGKPIVVVDWLSTFIHKDIEVKTWVISELRTGTLIATGDTQKRALDSAKELLFIAGQEKTLAVIDKVIAKYGEAPLLITKIDYYPKGNIIKS